ncbi:MAG: hypothetical protein K8R68_06830 [Bacteroidales bacterium]|nr:hypothetical protein [Bacteroidales bacterium]
MVTRDILKGEIDKVQEEYLTALYNIIKVFELPIGTVVTPSDFEANIASKISMSDWNDFIEETYGCLEDDPIERGHQGEYEIREAI